MALFAVSMKEGELNMRMKATSSLLAMLFVIGTVCLITSARADPQASPLPDYDPLDVGPALRALDPDPSLLGGDGADANESTSVETSLTILDVKVWLTLDDYLGRYVFTQFYLVAESEMTQIWVQADLSWPEGDARATPVITQEQVDYLLGEFDENIYPVDTVYFGTPDFHNGSNSLLEALGYFDPGYYSDAAGRDVILVSNIRDDMYYDSGYPYFIAGFYSPTFEYYFDRNIISIDSLDWANRVGPNGTRPYQFEGTIAHEYQHLIHDDYNSADETYMNEGCADFAELLCGYGVPWGHINAYLATPENSLTLWGDQGDINILADYGAAALWAIYLNDQFGDQFLAHFVQAGIPGAEGVTAALTYFGYNLTHDEVCRNWRVANLVHSGHGKYNYKSIDFTDEEAGELMIQGCTDFPVNLTGDLSAYAADYIKFSEWPRGHMMEKLLHFDGADSALLPNAWTLTESGWYSGYGDLLNNVLYSTAYVDPADPTLRIVTYWDIEDYWDFGFVQVSTDGGTTWISLENEYTTTEHDPNAHPDVISNLPGLTSNSGGFISMEFDLTAYAGQEILVGFRYVTDWATSYEGWYIQNATVSGAALTLEPLINSIEVDWEVTIVMTFGTGKGTRYLVWDMFTYDEQELGLTFVPISGHQSFYMIVSPVMAQGSADYHAWTGCHR